METEKLLCYVSMGIASLIALAFLMDALVGMLGGQSKLLDITFILGAVFVLWQGFETSRELR